MPRQESNEFFSERHPPPEVHTSCPLCRRPILPGQQVDIAPVADALVFFACVIGIIVIYLWGI